MDIFKINGTPIAKGETIRDFRGEEWVFRTVTQSSGAGSTGKVYVENPANPRERREFYPTVFRGTIEKVGG